MKCIPIRETSTGYPSHRARLETRCASQKPSTRGLVVSHLHRDEITALAQLELDAPYSDVHDAGSRMLWRPGRLHPPLTVFIPAHRSGPDMPGSPPPKHTQRLACWGGLDAQRFASHGAQLST